MEMLDNGADDSIVEEPQPSEENPQQPDQQQGDRLPTTHEDAYKWLYRCVEVLFTHFS